MIIFVVLLYNKVIVELFIVVLNYVRYVVNNVYAAVVTDIVVQCDKNYVQTPLGLNCPKEGMI